METKRYMLVIIGQSKGIGEDLNHVADTRGIHFVDGKGLFLATFYTEMSTSEIHEVLAHRPAFLLFDITTPENNAINLPAKYYTGLFPETEDITNIMGEIQTEEYYPNTREEENYIEEYDTIDEILDKLSRNDYNRECLTEKEIEILSKQ